MKKTQKELLEYVAISCEWESNKVLLKETLDDWCKLNAIQTTRGREKRGVR